MDAAEALFRKRGFHGVAVEEITAAVGVSKPNLYNHFRDKAEIYVAVRQRHIHRLETDLHRAMAVPAPFPERLFAAVAVLLRHPFFLNAMSMRDEEDFLSAEARDLLFATAFGGVYQPLMDLLQSGAAGGSLRFGHEDVPFAYEALIALVEGLAPPAERIPVTAQRIVHLLTREAG